MATVTGSCGSVNFGDGGGLSLKVNGLDPGRRMWRRITVTSPYIADEQEIAAVKDQTKDMVLTFRAKAASESALATLVGNLVTAVEAATWTFSVTVNGYARSWTCTRADTAYSFDNAHIRGFTATVTVFTTHKSTPVSGEF